MHFDKCLKTKGITTANHNKLYEARENAIDQIAVSFSFQSDWLRISVSFLSQSQSEDSQTKTILLLVFFDNHLKISLQTNSLPNFYSPSVRGKIHQNLIIICMVIYLSTKMAE